LRGLVFNLNKRILSEHKTSERTSVAPGIVMNSGLNISNLLSLKKALPFLRQGFLLLSTSPEDYDYP